MRGHSTTYFMPCPGPQRLDGRLDLVGSYRAAHERPEHVLVGGQDGDRRIDVRAAGTSDDPRSSAP